MATTQHLPPLPLPFTHSHPAEEPVLLAQGAEARLYKTHFLSPTTPAALKIRPSKPYRHPILDRRLTRQRILQEARCLSKLTREGVSVPGVFAADWEGSLEGDVNRGAWLMMEWVEGEVVRKVVDQWEKWIKSCQKVDEDGCSEGVDTASIIKKGEEDIRGLLRKIGNAVGLLHKTGVIHGDLTTSNLMLRPRNNPISGDGSSCQNERETGKEKPSLDGEIVLIDFGLAGQSVQDEDRAVDLYVLERAFASSHPRTEGYFDEVIAAYGESFKGARSTVKRLENVRLRGRKKSMVG